MNTSHSLYPIHKFQRMLRITAKLYTGNHCTAIHIHHIRIAKQFLYLAKRYPKEVRFYIQIFILVNLYNDITVTLMKETCALFRLQLIYKYCYIFLSIEVLQISR